MNPLRPLQFIVAEISKSWIDGEPFDPSTPILAVQFQEVIEVNRQRGYRLVTFQLHRLMPRPDEMNETIIAVFEHVGNQP